MAVKDYEGLIFQEIRKKVLNEESPHDEKTAQKASIVKTEVTNHIKISIFSGLKFGLGMILGSFIGMIIISTILFIVGLLLTASIGSFLNIGLLSHANMSQLT